MAILHKGCFQVTSWRQYPSAPNVAPVRDPCLAEPTSTNRVFWKVHLEGVHQGAWLTVPTSVRVYTVLECYSHPLIVTSHHHLFGEDPPKSLQLLLFLVSGRISIPTNIYHIQLWWYMRMVSTRHVFYPWCFICEQTRFKSFHCSPESRLLDSPEVWANPIKITPNWIMAFLPATRTTEEPLEHKYTNAVRMLSPIRNAHTNPN